MRRKVISIFMSACVGLTAISAGPFIPAVSAAFPAVCADSGDESVDMPSVFELQEGSGKCTLASAVMMLRQKSIIEGNNSWPNITQKSLAETAWLSGVGMYHSYTFYGMSVSYKDLSSADKKEKIIELLEEHPEGLEIYDRGIPHAVLLTRYDEEEDIFYCADPALSVEEMELSDSWMRKACSDADQDDIIDCIDCYWYVSAYKYEEILDSGHQDESDDSDSQGDASDESDAVIYTSGDPQDEDRPDDPDMDDPEGGDGAYDMDESDTSSDYDCQEDDFLIDDKSEENGEDDPVYQVNTEPKFSRIGSYETGQFADVDEDEWYISYIQTVYEMGIMKGIDGSRFGVKDNLTIAQTITMAARIHSIYQENDYDFEQSDDENWYMTYLEYAVENSVVPLKYASDDIDYNAFATREQFAEIITGAVPEENLVGINSVQDGDIEDVEESGTSGEAIYKMYRAGVLTGDAGGGFSPDSNITRAQVAAIMARLADETLRVTFDL